MSQLSRNAQQRYLQLHLSDRARRREHKWIARCLRYYSSSFYATAPKSTTSSESPQAARWVSSSVGSSAGGENLRVAVVGGGAAGLSTALHLAPLVEAGWVASPIDVYDISSTDSQKNRGRDIGVGIWSTALDPFRDSDRESHRLVYDEMTAMGTWVGDVGYRTPNGAWLMRSHLPVNDEERAEMNMPALLFLREKDFLMSLQKAVHWESLRGMIRVNRDGTKYGVRGIHEESSLPWSAQLKLNRHNGGDETAAAALTDRDYHLIVAADGTHSTLRRTYAGHDLSRRTLMGTAALMQSSPNVGVADAIGSSLNDPTVTGHINWDWSQQQDAIGLQDRRYTVFRGNAPLTREEVGQDGASFQTWGVGRNMRFASVPMLVPAGVSSAQAGSRAERQVWFITIEDDEIAAEPDAERRHEMLLSAFADWHDPIRRTVEATPPDDILMERAIAHRHSMGPVWDMNKILQLLTGHRPPNSGAGPCLIFLGDAYMTVDPILAQGFTMAMEGAAALRRSVQSACQKASAPLSPSSSSSPLAFDPVRLRVELKARHEGRIDRLICLLRATELVQALGQPAGGTVSGFFNTKILRPLMRVTPNFIKKYIFNGVLKYSLGLPAVSLLSTETTKETTTITTPGQAPSAPVQSSSPSASKIPQHQEMMLNKREQSPR